MKSVQAKLRVHDFDGILELLLIFVSSSLLGIWAVKGTIALRNTLLIVGAILAVVYLVRHFLNKGFRNSLSISNTLPIVMLGAMFFWVVSHYIFFSHIPSQQFSELKSTWVRSLLGFFLAIGTSLVVSKKTKFITLIWAGIFCSFLVLFYQYLSHASSSNTLYVVDYYGDTYLFNGKINAVLVGTILNSAFLGIYLHFADRGIGSKLEATLLLLCIAGWFLTTFSYVYSFDSRNGVALNLFIFLNFLLYVGVRLVRSLARVKSQKKSKKYSPSSLLMTISLIFALGLTITYFGFQNFRDNHAWLTISNDVSVASKSYDKSWQDINPSGMPNLIIGKVGSVGTYQRIAWASLGLIKFAPAHPLGVGILKGSFPYLIYQNYGVSVDNIIPSTHSAWVDLTLSYGFPGLILLMGSLILVMIRAFVGSQYNYMGGLIYIMSSCLLFCYAIGELAAGHGLEILVYLIGFLASLQMFTCTQKY